MNHEIDYLLNRINAIANHIADDKAFNLTPTDETLQSLRDVSEQLRALIGGGK